MANPTAPSALCPGRLVRCQARPSLAVVLVVAPPPEAALVTAERGAVEPLVHPPETVQPPRVRGVRVVHDAVIEHERAHARSLLPVRRPVGSHDARCELVEPGTFFTGRGPKVH